MDGIVVNRFWWYLLIGTEVADRLRIACNFLVFDLLSETNSSQF